MNVIDIMFFQYVETALWSSMDDTNESGGDPLDYNYSIEDIDSSCLDQMKKDCESFYNENKSDIGENKRYVELAGYHFWLTRNGHGSGFWDGDWDKDGDDTRGDRLTEACKKYKQVDLYIGDDDLIHC